MNARPIHTQCSITTQIDDNVFLPPLHVNTCQRGMTVSIES